MSNFDDILKQSNKIRLWIKRKRGRDIIPSYEEYEKLLKIINEDSRLRENFTIQDLDDFFRDPFVFDKSIYEMTKKEFAKSLQERLYKQPKEYHYYFRVNTSYKFVKNGDIGTGKILKFIDLPDVIKKTLEENYEHENVSDSYRWLSLDRYKEFRKDDYYMLVKVETSGRYAAEQLAKKVFKQNTAIFNFFTRDYFRQEEEVSNIYVNIEANGRNVGEFFGSHVSKSPQTQIFHVEYIPKINQIISKVDKNEIEKNILKVINMVGHMTKNPSIEVRFLFILISIETLLAWERQDYLNWRVSERLAFLLADNKYWVAYYKKIPEGSSKFKKITKKFIQEHIGESRSNLFETGKELYGKRSSIAHSKNNKEIISEKDYDLARNLLYLLTLKLLELVNNKISHYVKKSENDSHSLIEYINSLKFN